MKNISYFILSFITYTFLFSLNIYESKADDCPGGDNQKIETLYVNGCMYEVTICYKCAGTSAYGIVNVFSFRKIDPNCNQTWNTYQVLQSIYSQVYNWNYVKTYICLNDNLGPCEPYGGGIYFQYNFEICWQKRLETDGTLTYLPCSSGNTYCYAMFLMCWDATIPGVKYIQQSPYQISGDYDGRCKGVSEPSDPILPNEISGCFEIQTMCTP